MSKRDSYFDWERSFKKKKKYPSELIRRKDHLNSLGIPDIVYKTFLEEWKKKNLL